MNFLTAAYTDVGIRKDTNQDSLLIQKASTDFGPVLLAVICDGMGGLAKGEVASACMIKAFSEWFRNEFPGILYNGMQMEVLRDSWDRLVQSTSRKIEDYGDRIGVSLGTTCVALLIVDQTYYILNVGDSRIYLITDNVYQLTKDQTYVQREMDAGRMTYEQSLVDPQRSVLLQCIGASQYVEPAYYVGTVEPNQSYLLCCDGFRHVIDPAEFYAYLNPGICVDSDVMRANLYYLTEMNKQRRETDNITAALIRTY